MDEDPLQRRIYLLTFIDSLDIIFWQYIETCEVLIDYPKIGGIMLGLHKFLYIEKISYQVSQ